MRRCLRRIVRDTLLVFSIVGLLLSLTISAIPVAYAAEPANSDFAATWQRTDQPVAAGMAARTWMWAPAAFTTAFWEEYAESPGGYRAVQYFDKSRMEINDPNAVNDGLWYVTNGLLVVEMVAGNLQIGDASFYPRAAAGVPVAGDPDDTSGPTYAALDQHRAATTDRTGLTVTSRIARDGATWDDPGLAAQNVQLAFYDEVTGHNVAGPFWDFMQSRGLVYQSGQYVEDELFLNEFYATGRPITEPFFADVKVGGTLRLVLLQCFERRCLTYTPGNPEGWQVEAGNVGLHYFCWRYGYLPEGSGPCIGSPVEPPSDLPGGGETPPPPPGAPQEPPPSSPPGSPSDPPPAGSDPTPTSPSGGGSNPTPPSSGGDPTATTDPGASPTPTSPSGSPTASPTATGTVTPSATATTPAPTPTSPSNDDPGVDVLPLSLGPISAGIGETFTLPVQVRNTGTQADTVDVRLRTVGGITTCPFDATVTRVINPGETVTVNFTQTCTVALNLLVDYEATGTIDRAPGAFDLELDEVSITISVVGGGDPTPTATTPPSNGDPSVDLHPLNLPDIDAGIGESFSFTLQVTNTGTQTDSVDVRLRTTGGISTCPFDQTQTRTINPGQTVSVTFNQSCLVALNALATYEGSATINRAPGAVDTETDTALITIALLGGGDPTPTPTQPAGSNDPSVDLLPLNLQDVEVGIGETITWTVRVKNTGNLTDTVDIRFRSTGGISTCPIDQTTSRTINPGQTATVTFNQTCLIALNVVATYQATATVDRAPGASDSETDTAAVTVVLLGGGDPTPTPTTSPSPTPTQPAGGNAPSVDVLSLNFNDIDVGVGETFTLPVRVTNTGSQADSVDIRLRTVSGISLCPFDETQTRSINPGQTVTVNFQQSCLVVLGVLATYEATATIDRSPGASDSEMTSVLINVSLFGAGDAQASADNANDDAYVGLFGHTEKFPSWLIWQVDPEATEPARPDYLKRGHRQRSGRSAIG